MLKWIKNLFSKATKLVELKECEHCKGIGYYSGYNSDYRETKYWCDCKKIDGKYPGECATIDIRMETSYHTMVQKIQINVPRSFHFDISSITLPEPNSIFEPYIKIYFHNGIEISDKILFKKIKISGKITWFCLDHFSDDMKYSDLVSLLREERLKELGI
jgi:hypothetical protein